MPKRAKADETGNASELSGERPEAPIAGGEAVGAYEGLARRYRPADFGSVVGQKHVVQTLGRALETRQWAHAYLFVGGRGLGKTTMARILAKGINCDQGPTNRPCGACTPCLDIAASRDIDVLEIDAASHTGVDNVRDLIIQSVATAPARGRCKVFIIDEVHMLSTAAFNALLKTIEEPPSGILFILATTDGHKVPPTIRSRCQRFDFRPVSAADLEERLRTIASAERIEIADDALALIVEHAEGGVRDALSALDLVRAYATGPIGRGDVENALGLIPVHHLRALVATLDSGDAAAAVRQLGELVDAGADPAEIVRGLLLEYRRHLHAQLRGEAVSSRGRLVRIIEALLGAIDRGRSSRFPRLELEAVLCRIAATREEEVTLGRIWAQLQEIDHAADPVAGAQNASRPAAPGVSKADSQGSASSQGTSAPPRGGGENPVVPSSPAARTATNRTATAPASPNVPTQGTEPASKGAAATEAPQGELRQADLSTGAATPQDSDAEVVEMLQRIFNAEVVDISKRS